MSRFEGEFVVAGDAVLDLPELMRLVADASDPVRQRQAAIACYLSASEGWRDAVEKLDGAFTGRVQEVPGTGLSDGKEE